MVLLPRTKRSRNDHFGDLCCVGGVHHKQFHDGVGGSWLHKETSTHCRIRVPNTSYATCTQRSPVLASHLWVRNDHSARVLVLAVPGVLNAVHLCVIELHIRYVLPPGRPPQALIGREHLLWKGRKWKAALGFRLDVLKGYYLYFSHFI